MAISPLPTPPSRDDPANFAARGDAFLGALPDFATELNDALPTINDAIPASEIAVALVNYKGDYNSATTYLVGQSVTYNDVRFLSKKTNLNITPVDGNDWYELSAGVETTVRSILNQSSAITLLASDGGGYLLVSSTASVNINLPNATTLVGRTFVVKNIGEYPLPVLDSAGNYLFNLSPQFTSVIWASDISTAAGQWAMQEFPVDYLGASTALGGVGVGSGGHQYSISKLSTSQQVLSYTQTQSIAGSRPYAMIINQSSGTITTNTSYLLADEYASSIVVTMVSATTGVAIWTSSGSVRGCVITVSGTTITAATPVTVYSAASYGYLKLSMMSATTLVVGWRDTSPANIVAGIITISGTTFSVGTLVTLNSGATSSGYDEFFLGALTASLFALGTNENNSNLYLRCFTVSGSTITSGTALVVNCANYCDRVVGCVLTSSRFAVIYYDGNTSFQKFQIYSVSGTTPTGGTAVNLSDQGFYGTSAVNTMSASSGIVATFAGPSAIRYYGFTFSSSTITLGSSTTGSLGGYYLYTDLVAFQVPEVGGTPSTASYMTSRLSINGTNVQALSLSGTTITQNSFIYPVSAYADVNANTNTKQICGLSPTRAIFLCAGYGVGGVASNLYAVLVDYSTSTPTLLQALLVNTFANYASIAALTSTTAVITYRSTTNTNLTRLITMSGNNISVGSEATISSATTTTYQSVCRLTDTSAIAFYRNSSTTAYANVLTISGTSVSVGSAATVIATDITYPQVEALTSTTALAVFGGDGVDAKRLTISGTTITVGSSNDINISYATGLQLQVLSATKAIVASGGSSSGNDGGITCLTINGDTVTSGSQSTVSNMLYGFRMAFSKPYRGVAIASYRATYFQIDLANNAVSFSGEKPQACMGVAPLKIPATANNFAPKFALSANDGYSIQFSQISSIGAIN
jgi:hypothetical protein